jgi:hemerythrin superfamily protein
MSATAGFRRQHEELETAAFELLTHLVPDAPPLDSSEMRRKLARFTGKLKLHAAMEEEALYPRLLAHKDEELRQKARALLDEVGSLYGEYFAFSARWLKPGAIEEETSAFGEDLFRVLKLLGKRLRRENRELYPLVDALDPE